MLPARKMPCNPGNFFGKNYPRALGKLDEESRLIRGPDAEMPNKPFLREFSYATQALPVFARQSACKVFLRLSEAAEAYLDKHCQACISGLLVIFGWLTESSLQSGPIRWTGSREALQQGLQASRQRRPSPLLKHTSSTCDPRLRRLCVRTPQTRKSSTLVLPSSRYPVYGIYQDPSLL